MLCVFHKLGLKIIQEWNNNFINIEVFGYLNIKVRNTLGNFLVVNNFSTKLILVFFLKLFKLIETVFIILF